MEKKYKIVVYVPESHGDALRSAMGEAGAGVIGDYTHCMFTLKGTGQFKPGEGADPYVGEVGKLNKVEEERIETVCESRCLSAIIKAIRTVHPYEEPAFDVYPIELVA